MADRKRCVLCQIAKIFRKQLKLLIRFERKNEKKEKVIKLKTNENEKEKEIEKE